MPPSQSVLIGDTFGYCVKIYLNFKGSLTAWLSGLFENSVESFVRIVTLNKKNILKDLKVTTSFTMDSRNKFRNNNSLCLEV